MSKVELLMKRCQRGVGGFGALNEAHDIMAECYGMLGKLDDENKRLRKLIDEITDDYVVDHLDGELVKRIDAALSAKP